MTGVTTYDVDPGLTFATFVLGGQVHVADLVDGGARPLEGAAGGAFDARPDPTGRRLAYVVDGALHVQRSGGGVGSRPRLRRRPRHPVGCRRVRGRGGAGASSRLLVVARRRADRGGARRRAPGARVAHRLAGRSGCAAPRGPVPAGGHRQRGRLAVGPRARRVTGRRRLGPRCVPVPRPRHVERPMPADAARPVARSEALGRARGRRRLREDAGARRPDRPSTGRRSSTGVPDRLADGRLVFVEETEDTRRITVDGEPVTPPGLQVATILDVGDDILFAAQDDPTELHVWRGRGWRRARTADVPNPVCTSQLEAGRSP